jgi:hypothetical protein
LLSHASVMLIPSYIQVRKYRVAVVIVLRILRDRVELAREVVGRVEEAHRKGRGIPRTTSCSRRPAWLCGGCSSPRQASGGELSFEFLIWDSSWADLRIPRTSTSSTPALAVSPLLLLRIHPWQRPRHCRRAIGITPLAVSIVPCYSCE